MLNNIQGEPDTYGLKMNFEEEYDDNYVIDESEPIHQLFVSFLLRYISEWRHPD